MRSVFRLIIIGACSAAAGLLFAGCGADSGADESGSGFSVLVIVADALRADSLGCYGQAAPTSPNIDRLATEGALFENCTTVVPTTLPSFISLVTSVHPKDHGSFRNGVPPVEGLAFVSEAFRDADRETAFFAASYCLTKRFGLDRGIDHFDDRLVRSASLPFNKLFRNATDVTDAFLSWLAGRDARKPFFAVVHYFDPHIPYVPPERFARLFLEEGVGPHRATYEDTMAAKRRLELSAGMPGPRDLAIRKLYLAEIRYMDTEIGRLIEVLDASPGGGDTLVVFTADHGHNFWGHDVYFNHSRQVYGDNIRIPLIFRWPERVAPARRAAPAFSSIDLAPTLLGLAGIAVPEEFAGEDLHAAVLRGDENRKQDLLYSEAYHERAAGDEILRPNFAAPKCIMQGSWKYIWTPHRENREELYDLTNDPDERNNLAGSVENAGRVDMMRDKLRRWALIHAAPDGSRADVPDEVLEKLRALGYGR